MNRGDLLSMARALRNDMNVLREAVSDFPGDTDDLHSPLEDLDTAISAVEDGIGELFTYEEEEEDEELAEYNFDYLEKKWDEDNKKEET